MRVRTLLCVVSLAVFNTGCLFNVQPLAKDVYDTIADAVRSNRPAPEAWHGLDFRHTELYGLFLRHEPFNSNKPADEQFPRVAITVLDAPPIQSHRFMNPTKSCWKLRAKIWLDPKEYRFVAPFNWCSPRNLLPAPVPLGSANTWFYSGGSGANTGNQRNDGPIPPAAAVPTDLRHQTFWGFAGFDTESMNGKMFVSVLYYMGFDWTNGGDRRVWIVEFSQTHRESL